MTKYQLGELYTAYVNLLEAEKEFFKSKPSQQTIKGSVNLAVVSLANVLVGYTEQLKKL